MATYPRRRRDRSVPVRDGGWSGRERDYIRTHGNSARVFGNTGDDWLDYFEFVAISDSTASARDSIMNFGAGDRIDVSRIDAVSVGGNQVFDFTGASGGAGDLWVVDSGADAIVFAQTQAGARLVVRVAGAADHDWGAGDFIL